jgi:flagellar biosynthesis protein FlhF
MKIKRFVAKDMRTALTEVKEFLGPDAIILSNKKVAGGVEIVAAIDPEAVPQKAQAEIAPAAPAAVGSRLNIKIDDEQEQAPADSLQALLARQISKQPAAAQAISANKMAAAKTAAATSALFSVANSAPSDNERQSSGAPMVNLTELTRYQEQQAKLMQKQFDAMRNEMSSMKQLLQHQVSGLMWQELARREPVRAMVIEKFLALGLSEPVADQIGCFMPEDISDAEAWDSALELLAGQLITTNDDIMRRGGIVGFSRSYRSGKNHDSG